MLLACLLLIVGFYALIKGADLLIDGSAAVAKLLGVSPLVIGITIVGFGTSTPELMTSVIAAYKNESSIVLGNVIGSNIANVALILGVAALITPLAIKSITIKREIPFTIAASLAMLFLILDNFLNHNDNYFSRADGMVLLVFFAIFIYYTVFSVAGEISEKKKLKEQVKEVVAEKQEETGGMSTLRMINYIILGLIGVVAGGIFVVNNSIYIAEYFNLSKAFIGFTIIALGTSLPELVTSAVAAYKKEADVAVGNIVGSNIFNLLAVLAISGTISPFGIKGNTIVDAIIMTIVMIILFTISITRRTITRFEGGLLVFIYIIVMAFSVYREVSGFELIS